VIRCGPTSLLKAEEATGRKRGHYGVEEGSNSLIKLRVAKPKI